jgi:hypothetical protein
MKKKVSQEQHGNINQREEETHEGQEWGGLLSQNRPWGLDQRFLTCGPRTPGDPRRLLRGYATV